MGVEVEERVEEIKESAGSQLETEETHHGQCGRSLSI